MNTAPPDLVPGVTSAPEVLIREARRRQRRRYLVVSAAIAAVIATAVALVGGSGGGGRPRTSSPEPSPRDHFLTPAAARGTGLVTVSQTRLPKPYPSEAVGYGAVWLTGIGVTYEISETTGRIVRTISTPGTFYEGCGSGIAAGAGAVWVTHFCRGVYRIDPHSGRVTASIRVPDAGNAIEVADGLVWVTNYNGWLLRIQPRTDRIVGKWIPVGFGGWGITRTASALWVTSYFGSPTVSRIDLTTGAAKVLPNFVDIAAAGAGSLWTSAGQRVDPATLKVIAPPAIPRGAMLVTFWKGSAWALIEWRSLELVRISPATDEVSGEPVLVGKPLPAGYGREPVAVAGGPTGLWVLDYGRNLLFRLVMKPATAAVPSQRR